MLTKLIKKKHSSIDFILLIEMIKKNFCLSRNEQIISFKRFNIYIKQILFIYNQIIKTKQQIKQNIIYSMSQSNSMQFFDSDASSELHHESFSHKQRINTLWTKEENLIYIAFLKEHRDIFTTEEIRRHNKVFIMLAKLLPSRSSDQCRSHHQKMIISHKNIDRIIKHLEKKMTKILIKKQKREAKVEQACPRETQAQSLNETVFQSRFEITQLQISNQQLNEEDLWNVLA